MVSAPGLGPGRRGSIPCFPTQWLFSSTAEQPVEARKIPVRFRGEPPCPTGLTAMTPVLQTGDRGSIPRWGSRAPRAIRVKHSTLNRRRQGSSPWRRTTWGSRATGRRSGFKYRIGAGSNPASPTSASSWCRVGRRRPQQGPDPCPRRFDSCSGSAVQATMPPRTAAAPLPYSGRPGSAPGGGSLCSYSNLGREAGPRCRMLRVRIPPSARRRWAMGEPADPLGLDPRAFQVRPLGAQLTPA